MESIQELVLSIQLIVKMMVDSPNEVIIHTVQGEQTTVLQLTVAKADLGKVIGKQGKNISAVRTILQTICARLKVRAVIELME